MKTLKDAIEAKQKLEQDILALVREFEVEYSLGVVGVDIRKHYQLTSGYDKSTFAVEVKVEV